MIGYVYKITNLVNGKIYIGQRHWNGNPADDAYMGSGGRHFTSALEKYGRENFSKEILKVCDTDTQLNVWELYYTKKFNPTLDPKVGYNRCFGPVQVAGNRNPALHPDVHERLTKHCRRLTADPEYRRKQSERTKAWLATHENPFKGKRHTEETKARLRQIATGRPAPNKGKPVSEQARRLQSERLKKLYAEGMENPMTGRLRITDGVVNSTILAGAPIPEGWRLGMAPRKK